MSELFTDEQINERRSQRPYDRLLDAVMDFVFGENDEGGPEHTFSVTVSVNGQIISGQAISGKAWAEGVKNELGGTGLAGEKLGELVTGIVDVYAKVAAEVREEAKEKEQLTPGRGYLHLREVNSGGFANLTWVRVRMDSIDAWSFGRRG